MKELLTFLTVDIFGFLMEHVGYPIAGGIGAGINWLLNKRKINAEAQTIELSNEAQIINKWMQWGDKMERELSEVKEELKQQKIECAEETKRMQQQIAQHEKRIRELEDENKHLQSVRLTK